MRIRDPDAADWVVFGVASAFLAVCLVARWHVPPSEPSVAMDVLTFCALVFGGFIAGWFSRAGYRGRGT